MTHEKISLSDDTLPNAEPLLLEHVVPDLDSLGSRIFMWAMICCGWAFGFFVIAAILHLAGLV